MIAQKISPKLESLCILCKAPIWKIFTENSEPRLGSFSFNIIVVEMFRFSNVINIRNLSQSSHAFAYFMGYYVTAILILIREHFKTHLIKPQHFEVIWTPLSSRSVSPETTADTST